MDLNILSKENKIQIWLFLSLLGSGLEPVLIKLFRPEISPLSLIVLKSLVGCCLIFPFIGRINNLHKADFIPLFQVSILAFVTNALIFISLQTIPATTLITIITITPLVVAVMNHRRGIGKLSVQFLFAFITVFAGVLLTIEVFGKKTELIINSGLGIALVSVLTSAFYRIKMDTLTNQIDPFSISVSLFFFNGLLSLCFLPIVTISEKVISFGIWLGFAGVTANIFFLYAIKHLGSTKVSILSVIQRPLAVIFGAILLKEMITPMQFSGMMLIFGGIFFAKTKPFSSKKNSI